MFFTFSTFFAFLVYPEVGKASELPSFAGAMCREFFLAAWVSKAVKVHWSCWSSSHFCEPLKLLRPVLEFSRGRKTELLNEHLKVKTIQRKRGGKPTQCHLEAKQARSHGEATTQSYQRSEPARPSHSNPHLWGIW